VNALVTLDGSGSSDADGDGLTYDWSITSFPGTTAPALSDSTAVKPTFTPSLAGDYIAQLIVGDGLLTSDPDTALVKVSVPPPVNQPPSITSTAVTTATAGAAYSYQVTATDPNAGDVLSYALSTAPTGMTIGATTGLIQWTPGTAGDFPVTVTVSDGNGGTATQPFTLTVKAQVTVPSVIGLSLTAATSALQGAGLTLGTVTLQYSDTVAEDLVISQNLAAGSLADAGKVVNVALSLGKSPSATLDATLVDVSGQVQVLKSDLAPNPQTGTLDATLTLTNTLLPITGPLALIVTPSDANVILANADGYSADGKSFLVVPIPQTTLAPGETLPGVTLQFANSSNSQLAFDVRVLAHVTPSVTDSQVTAVIDAAGGDVTLPGVATLHIPPGTVQSSAIQISKLPSDTLTNLINGISNYQPLPIPPLRIKSSVPFGQPVQIIQTLPASVVVSQGGVKYASHIRVDNDDDATEDTLEFLEAKLCGHHDAVCATLDPSAFSPLPLDPSDPVIEIALVTTVVIQKAIQQFLEVPSDSIQPSGQITIDTAQPNSTVNFQAHLNLRRKSNFAPSTPLRSIFFTDSYKLWRVLNNPPRNRPHKGVDLRADSGTAVYSVESGSVLEAREEGGGTPCPNGTSSKSQSIALGHVIPSDFDVFFSFYRHLEKFLVAKGGAVVGGEQIARSDTTGACAPHLHFDIGLDSPKGLQIVSPIDPRPLLLDDMSQYLLPKDPDDQPPFVHGQELNSAFKGLMLYLKLRINGVEYGILNTLSANDLIHMPMQWRMDKAYSGAAIQPLPSGPNGSQLTIDGRSAQIAYQSGDINIVSALNNVVNKYFPGDNIDDLLMEDTTVVLETCSFRLNYCHDLAEWVINNTSLTVDATTGSTGTGTATSIPQGINCKTGDDKNGPNCTSMFSPDGTVTLTAKPDPDFIFTGWSGDACAFQSVAPDGSGGTCIVTMDGKAKNITANFGDIFVGRWIGKMNNGSDAAITIYKGSNSGEYFLDYPNWKPAVADGNTLHWYGVTFESSGCFGMRQTMTLTIIVNAGVMVLKKVVEETYLDPECSGDSGRIWEESFTGTRS